MHGDVGVGGGRIPDMGPTSPPNATDIWWSSLETCSNLFTYPPLSSVILSTEGGSNVTIIHGELDLTVRGLPTWGTSLYRPLLVTSGGHHWGPVQTSSLEDSSPHQYRHLGATETVTVGKWAVCILECLLVC